LHFEPVAGNYYALTRNVALNHLDDKIRAYPVALSGVTKLGVMNVSSASMGASRNQFGEPANNRHSHVGCLRIACRE